jgi:hypothetical protein
MNATYKIILRKSEQLPDWFLVVRAEHDGRMEFIGDELRASLFCSERIGDGFADVEGSRYELEEIINAIQTRRNWSFKRIGLYAEPHGGSLHSPKNSMKLEWFEWSVLDEFAKQASALLQGEI